MCLPAIDAVREAYPNAFIAVASREHLFPCFSSHPGVDEVLSAPKSGGISALLKLWQSGGRLRARAFDIGLLFTNSFSTAIWLWRCGVRQSVGYDRDGRGILLDDAVPVTEELAAAHMTDYYLHLCAHIGADPGGGILSRGAEREPVLPKLFVPQDGRNEASRIIKERKIGKRFAVLAPASAYGSVKDWPVDYYCEIASRIGAEIGMEVLVSGTSAQSGICSIIAEKVRHRVHNIAGATSMGGFLGLLEKASLFVGGDSGGAHAAAALDVPTVVIFGITEPSRTRQLGRRVKLIGEGGMVTPDLRSSEVRRQAKAALEAISVDEVWCAIEALGASVGAGALCLR